MIIDNKDITAAAILKQRYLHNQRVLEVGCGDGRITQKLAVKVKYLIAIDTDSAIVTRAKTALPHLGVFTASGEALPFENSSFDCVLFSLSLHHQNSDRALLEAFRVLKDGGTVITVEPMPDGQIEKICNLFEDETEALASAQEAIQSSGYECIGTLQIYPEWIFNDFQELHSWLFEYYRIPFDLEKITEVNRLLGKDFHQRPITLLDKLKISHLKKQ